MGYTPQYQAAEVRLSYFTLNLIASEFRGEYILENHLATNKFIKHVYQLRNHLRVGAK